MDYLPGLIAATPTPGAEIRLFDFGARFAGEFRSLRANLRTERLALSARQARDRLVAALMSFLALPSCRPGKPLLEESIRCARSVPARR